MTTSMIEDDQSTEALKHNGSDFLVPGYSIPFSTVPIGTASLADLSMEQLDQMVNHEQSILAILNRAGQAILRDRLMIIFTEMSQRFESGESFKGLTGNKAMGAYLRNIGFDPGKLRAWKFHRRREEAAALVGETLSAPKAAKPDAAGGDHATISICGDETTPVGAQEVEPPEVTVRTSVMGKALSVPTAGLGAGNFETVADLLKSRCLSLFSDCAVQRIVGMLDNRPGILAHAQCLEELAIVLRSTAEDADNLARKISTTLAAALRTEV